MDYPATETAAKRPLSPCVGICELDEAERLCIGCGRTVLEISNWLKLDEAERQAIWDELPARLEACTAAGRRGG